MDNVPKQPAGRSSNNKCESEWPSINSRSKAKSLGIATVECVVNSLAPSTPSSIECSLSERFPKLEITSVTSHYDPDAETRPRQQILDERKLRKIVQKQDREEQKINDKLIRIREPASDKIKVIDRNRADQIQAAASHNQSFSRSRHARNKECNLSEFLDTNLTASTQVAFYAGDQWSTTAKTILNPATQLKGKVREVPKPKQLTALKKTIVHSRETRKANINHPENEFGTGFINDPEPTKKDNDEDHETETVPQSLSSSSKPNIQNGPFSRKFRTYCNNLISPELCDATESLLRDIFRFQDRAYNKNEIKARAHRRFVVGFKETQRQLEIDKLKLLVIAPDLEPTSTEQFEGSDPRNRNGFHFNIIFNFEYLVGGLEALVEQIKAKCDEKEIPYVFSLKRWKLGRILLKKVPVSCVGIINADGSEENFAKVKVLLREQRNLFNKTTNLN